MDPNNQYQPMADFCPNEDFQFAEFLGKPFHPFIRTEKISRCCDFSKQTQVSKDAEDDFEIVGQKTLKKPNAKKVAFVPPPSAPVMSYQSYFQVGRKNKLSQAAKRTVNYKKCRFKDSINIQPDWITVHESQKQNIDKVSNSNIEIAQLFQSGTIKRYIPAYDKVKPNYDKPLDIQGGEVFSSCIADDPYLRQLIETNNGAEDVPTIYTTDKLLFAIMTLKYGVFPWDVQVTKKGNQLVFDKCVQNKTDITYLELQTINENITIDMPEDEKQIKLYCEESTLAAVGWHLMSTNNGEIVFQTEEDQKENVYHSDELGFRYLECTVKDKIDRGSKESALIGPIQYKVVVRTSVEAVDKEDRPVLVKGLNECETPANWKKQLQAQAGLITNTAQVYNTNNIAKWLCQAQLLGSDSIKIGYLARQQSKDHSKHTLLMVETFNFKELAATINFKLTECWQNLRYLVEFLKQQEDGNYILLKSAYKSSFRVFRISDNLEEQIEEEDNALL